MLATLWIVLCILQSLVTFSQNLKKPPARQNASPNQILGITSFGSQIGLIGVAPTFLNEMSTIYSFSRFGTSKAHLQIPSCHFPTLTKNWRVQLDCPSVMYVVITGSNFKSETISGFLSPQRKLHGACYLIFCKISKWARLASVRVFLAFSCI